MISEPEECRNVLWLLNMKVRRIYLDEHGNMCPMGQPRDTSTQLVDKSRPYYCFSNDFRTSQIDVTHHNGSKVTTVNQGRAIKLLHNLNQEIGLWLLDYSGKTTDNLYWYLNASDLGNTDSVIRRHLLKQLVVNLPAEFYDELALSIQDSDTSLVPDIRDWVSLEYKGDNLIEHEEVVNSIEVPVIKRVLLNPAVTANLEIQKGAPPCLPLTYYQVSKSKQAYSSLYLVSHNGECVKSNLVPFVDEIRDTVGDKFAMSYLLHLPKSELKQVLLVNHGAFVNDFNFCGVNVIVYNL